MYVLCMCVHMYCVCVYECVCTYVCVCVYVCMYMCVCVCVYVYMYELCMCMYCVYVYVCVYVCIVYVCIYVYMYVLCMYVGQTCNCQQSHSGSFITVHFITTAKIFKSVLYNKLDHISNTAMYNVESYFYLNKDTAVTLINVQHIKC